MFRLQVGFAELWFQPNSGDTRPPKSYEYVKIFWFVARQIYLVETLRHYNKELSEAALGTWSAYPYHSYNFQEYEIGRRR